MKKIFFTLIVLIVFNALVAQQTKIISDCTITFTITDSDTAKQNNLGSKIIYIKGKDIRTDLISNNFSQTFFYNGNSGDATILKTVGQSKYISFYNTDEWKKKNEMYNGISVSLTGKTKNILNYECKEALLKLTNGNTYTVYYIPAIIPSIVENQFEFKDIPGLILEYEASAKGSKKITCLAQKIDFSPVPSLQFEIPKKGYRVLSNSD